MYINYIYLLVIENYICINSHNHNNLLVMLFGLLINKILGILLITNV